MKQPVILFFLVLISLTVTAQSISVEEYINTYKEFAIREMKRMGVPASITLAQGILETESGNSALVKKSNNHFGIKCKSSWSGSSVSHDDDAEGECFRKYNTAEESYRDHSNFLRGSDRYAFLFKLSPDDYKGWAHGLKKAGYATNPAYPNILIKNIERYNLQQYTLEGNSEVPDYDETKYENDKALPVSGQIPGSNTEQPVSKADGKTLFNGLKAVFATKGTSLLAIATEYNVALARLLEFNDMKEDGLLQDDSWIFLERKLGKGNRDFYYTQKEESLHEIAQLNALQLSQLQAYNGLSEDVIVKAGTKIYLRPVVQNLDASVIVDGKVHEVKPKEGLYAISKKYNVSVQNIREWNNLSSDDLRIGQKLIISK